MSKYFPTFIRWYAYWYAAFDRWYKSKRPLPRFRIPYVALIVIAMLWLWSCFYQDVWILPFKHYDDLNRTYYSFNFASGQGCVGIGIGHMDTLFERGGFYQEPIFDRPGPWHHRLHDGQFRWYCDLSRETGRLGITHLYAQCPYWFVCCLFLIRPAWRWSVAIRRKDDGGFCVKCGYDLRASPDRCPECGTPRKKPDPQDRALTSLA